jgi:hypothetical protein
MVCDRKIEPEETVENKLQSRCHIKIALPIAGIGFARVFILSQIKLIVKNRHTVIATVQKLGVIILFDQIRKVQLVIKAGVLSGDRSGWLL